MANTFPHARPPHPDTEHSLPSRLAHKPLDRAPFALKDKERDREYLPDASHTQSRSSASQSEEESSFSRSSYDPLENMEEYLRMRDKL